MVLIVSFKPLNYWPIQNPLFVVISTETQCAILGSNFNINNHVNVKIPNSFIVEGVFHLYYEWF